MTVSHAHRPKLTNAERCKQYRQKMLQDPILLKRMRDDDKARAKRNQMKAKTPEQIEHEKMLQRERQKRYEERKRQQEANDGAATRPQTRLDKEKLEKKRASNRLAVQKRRENQSAQKRRRTNEKRMARYYHQKEEAKLALQARNVKGASREGASREESFQKASCPYPTEEAFKKAVQRVKVKLKTKGRKFAFLLKGLVSSADKDTKKVLKELHVSTTPKKNQSTALQTHLDNIRDRLYKNSLRHKRRLAEACSCEDVGFSKRFLSNKHPTSPYSKRKPSCLQADIREFFNKNSVADPCKKSKTRQLHKNVKELHQDFTESTKKKVSLRSFHRHKPKNVASVRKLKFHQCLCEVCLNPKLKVGRLNSMMSESKCGSVRELMKESMCEFSHVPHLLCVDRKCAECGVEQVGKRLRECLGEKLEMQIGWSRWEHVKQGNSLRMEKVKKSGSVGECVNELLKELGPLCRHVFNAKWQRRQLQQLKAELPADWALVTCDFAENFVCKCQDQPQSAHWAYRQVTVFPVVVFTKCHCGAMRRDCLIFLSDDLKHDAHFTQVCVQSTLKHIGSVVKDLKKVVLVSDGCAAQFKSKLPFLYLSNTQVPGMSNVAIEKVFFGARHGKNDSDWCGGMVKRAVTRDIASGKVTVSNAHDVYQHCLLTLSEPAVVGQCHHKVQEFFLVEQHDVQRKINSSMLATVPGSRKIHHLRALSPGVLATRQLSCFCTACMSEQYELCLSCSHVDKWEIVKLKYSGSLPVTCNLPAQNVSEPSDLTISSGDSSSESDLKPELVGLNLQLKSDSEVESPVVSESDSSDYESRQVHPALPVPPPSVEATVNEDRVNFFAALIKKLEDCTTFEQVQLLSEQQKDAVNRFVLPWPTFLSPVGASIDRTAWLQLDPEVQDVCFPLHVHGDGNCFFFRSVSLALFGNEEHHIELRCRTAMEMARNPSLFLDGRNWIGIHDTVSHEEVINVAAMTSVSLFSSPLETFQREVMSVLHRSTFTGLWELFAASLVTKCTVQSVHPSVGCTLYRSHCNRIIRAPGASSTHRIFIMRSSTREDVTGGEHRVPNHFVPLTLRSPSFSLPRLYSFHKLMWNGAMYVGQIVETDELLRLCCVSFMTVSKKGATCVYSRPQNQDTSWEPVSCVQEEVSLVLDENFSNQRTQYYKVFCSKA